MYFFIDIYINFMYNKSKLREQSNQKRRKEDERIKKRN